MQPDTHYARSGAIHIAYQVTGDGDHDVVYLPGIWSHLEYFWREPLFARFIDRLSSFCRVTLLDTRGVGLSDRPGELPLLEHQVDDILGVLDSVGSERTTLLGISQSGPMAVLFAATHPARTSGLVLYGTCASARAHADYRWGRTQEWIDDYFERIDREWGSGTDYEMVAPSYVDDAALRAWWAGLERHGSAPGNAMTYLRAHSDDDVRAVLPSVSVPTLVLHRGDDAYRDSENRRYIADHVPGATFVELEGMDHLPYFGDQEAVLGEIESFLTGDRSTSEPDRVLATVLFTDIVGSTELASELGDDAWRTLLDRHNRAVRDLLVRFRGREVNTAGDGFLATFDGPARAIRCALALRDEIEALGIRIRAGVHTGEVEIIGDDIGGISVHVGARVATVADPGEVLVSRTVKDLVAGSGIEFSDRGRHRLKGVPDEWSLFSAD